MYKCHCILVFKKLNQEFSPWVQSRSLHVGIKCRHQDITGSAGGLAAGWDISNDPVDPGMANWIITYMSLKAPKLNIWVL